MSEKKINVKLLTYTKEPIRTITSAIKQCYSADTAAKIAQKVDKKKAEQLIKQIISSGHTSTIEHAYFTFAIEGISRSLTHQLVRHRIASYSQQSQRYVDLSKDDMGYIVPPEIKKNKKLLDKYEEVMRLIEKEYKELVKSGVKPEDARFILPNACQTKIVVTMNARSLLNFFRERCCLRAQWEIRELAGKMLLEVKKVAPKIFENAGASCVSTGICWEGNMSCGLWKTIKGAELKSRLKKI